jgi:hypothetical protein
MNKRRAPVRRLAIQRETIRRLDATRLARAAGAMKADLTEGCPPLPTPECASWTNDEWFLCCVC